MKAVIYARYSSDNQREESIEGQLRECKIFADKQDITVLNTYIDRALSAKTDDRPDFQKMIADSEKKLFDVIIVWKLDRFARNRYDSAHYKRLLNKNGVKVVSATEPISNDATGILLESMLEGMAEYYSAELAEKIGRGLTENVLKGKYNGGPLTMGYKIDENRNFVIDPLTAPVVLDVFKMYDDGHTMKEICKTLNAKGITTSRGTPIVEQILFWLLRFRQVDTTVYEQRQRLIDTFVNAIYIFDDEINFVFNCKDGSKTVSAKELEVAKVKGKVFEHGQLRSTKTGKRRQMASLSGFTAISIGNSNPKDADSYPSYSFALFT